jgi:hypothetical protein
MSVGQRPDEENVMKAMKGNTADQMPALVARRKASRCGW